MERHLFYQRHGKRVVDVVLAGAALIMLVPVLALVALGVRVSLGRPVLFRQARAGRDGVPFILLKFRTMRDEAQAPGATDAERLTPVGKWLRRWSLDELPTLINVLRGDMSVVGPRPLFQRYVPLYTDEQRVRLAVRPGITGWAQIKGRNSLTWEEKFRLDVWYVRNMSAGLDITILLGTFKAVTSGAGVSAEGHATMPPFQGTRPE